MYRIFRENGRLRSGQIAKCIADNGKIHYTTAYQEGKHLNSLPHGRYAEKVLALSFQSVAGLWSWAEENGWGQ